MSKISAMFKVMFPACVMAASALIKELLKRLRRSAMMLMLPSPVPKPALLVQQGGNRATL
ncbi:hypothetical protein V2H45_00570 [Tumidithrix elongata RA019]|uniref:Uncharacterized protein n=1 Tax=Tumidithrix elongata BACA0141 TaxID=2716417 RepID=A0AAW9PXJ2_9CYAN|nr:hypothetical protein [Tumidithrix elongata RA019]